MSCLYNVLSCKAELIGKRMFYKKLLYRWINAGRSDRN